MHGGLLVGSGLNAASMLVQRSGSNYGPQCAAAAAEMCGMTILNPDGISLIMGLGILTSTFGANRRSCRGYSGAAQNLPQCSCDGDGHARVATHSGLIWPTGSGAQVSLRESSSKVWPHQSRYASCPEDK